MPQKTHETPKTANAFDVFKISKDMFAAQQNFMPNTHFLERWAEAARNVTQAQINYGQALMRANAAFLSACFEPRAELEREERDAAGPSTAARQPEFTSQ